MSFLGRDTSRMKTRPALCGGAIVRIWFLGFNFASMIWPWKCHGPHCFQVGVRELGSNVESKLWRLVHLAWALFPVYVRMNFGTLRYFGESIWCFSMFFALWSHMKSPSCASRHLVKQVEQLQGRLDETFERLKGQWRLDVSRRAENLSKAKLANGCQNWIFELHTVDSCK